MKNTKKVVMIVVAAIAAVGTAVGTWFYVHTRGDKA